MKRRPRTTGNTVVKTWLEEALLDEPAAIDRRIAMIESASEAIDAVPVTRFYARGGCGRGAGLQGGAGCRRGDGGLVQEQRRVTAGVTLSAVIRRNDPRPSAEALLSFAADLDRLHERGLIHWDVKPANILYDGEALFLIDWEPSLLQYRDGRATAVVTRAYVAPSERGSVSLTARTDRFGWIKTLVALGLELPDPVGAHTDDESIERWIAEQTAVAVTRQLLSAGVVGGAAATVGKTQPLYRQG